MAEADAVIASLKGYFFEVEAGKPYLWCSCGRSKTQPLCDGASHDGTGFRPLLFKAKARQEVIFCGCKHTRTPPFCDGSHNNIEGAYLYDDPESESNRAIRWAQDVDGPVTRLDDRCFVFHSGRAALDRQGAFGYAAVVNPDLGAQHQSQFYAELDRGTSPVISADGRDTILFVADGDVVVEIGERRVVAPQKSGVYVRPGEAYRIVNEADARARLFISNGPGSVALTFLDAMPPLGSVEGERLESVDPAQRHAMADRHFQLLINRRHGSEVVTQFIGNIPLSKGMPHRHLYEEALIILSGEGVVWNETLRTPIGAGDVLFLPRKHLHSVQCLSETGMDVVGVIFPGDNPAVNY